MHGIGEPPCGCDPAEVPLPHAILPCDTEIQGAGAEGEGLDAERLVCGDVRTKVKESRDAEKLFADIKKKFFENDRGSHKGVTQLLDCAMAIQNGNFFFDNPAGNSVIYPVLVVENPVYSMHGMHTVLEYMMREECSRLGMRSDTIKPLVLVDVATLKLYTDYLNNRGLVQSFEDYYKHIDLKGAIVQKDQFESLISFTDYMKDKDLGNMHNVFDKLIREAKPILRHYN